MLIGNISNITFNPVKSAIGDLKIELFLNCAKDVLPAPELQELSNTDLNIPTIVDLPKIKYDWNDKEFWFGVGNCTITFYDKDEHVETAIRDMTFDYENSYITITKLADSSIYFKGFFDSDQYKKNNKNELDLTFNPLTEKLARTPVQINGLWNNVVPGYLKDNSYNLTTYITDVLKAILDPALTVNYYCDWEFYHAGFEEWLSFEELTINQLRWLFQNISTDERYYYTNSYKDVINNFCRTFGFVVFFESFNKISFVQYLNYNSTDVVTQNGLIDIINYNRSRNNSQTKFVKIYAPSCLIRVTGSGNPPPPPLLIPAYELAYGEYTGLNNDNLDIRYILNWASFRGLTVGKIRNRITLEEYDYNEYILQYYARYYTSHYNQIEDDLTVSGVFMQPNQKLKFRDLVYFPLSIEYDIAKNTTKIKGRPFMKEVSGSTEFPVYNSDLSTLPETDNFNTPGYDDGSKIINEILYIDSTIKTYSLLHAYKIGSIEIFRNGQKLVKDNGYTEDNNNEITFLIDFYNDDIFQVNYYKL